MVDGLERAYEPEGVAWLREGLPMIVRRTGFNADADVAEMLRKSGPAGVLSEISRLQTDYVRGVYFTAFLKQARPAGMLLVQMIEQASAEISSDHELGELLIKTGTTMPLNTHEWDAYFDAFSSMSSDWEHRRVLSAVVDIGLPADTLARLVQSSRGIRSSYERASFLIHIAERQRVEGPVRTADAAGIARRPVQAGLSSREQGHVDL